MENLRKNDRKFRIMALELAKNKNCVVAILQRTNGKLQYI